MMGRRASCLLLPLVLVAAAVRPAAGADDAGAEFFEKKVRPVLVAHCYECHGPDKQEAGLQVDTVGGMLRGGDQGPAVVPGDPEASLLIKGLRYDDVDFQMPPKGKIAAEKIKALEDWVKMGAPAPADEKKPVAGTAKKKFDLAERAKHWCFQPLTKTTAPQVQNAAWARTDIDRYILAKLEASKLQPAAPADKPTLIRRVTFDLTGLPPMPADVAAFTADESPEAFAKVVDRLLASPRFGERWARHWLDLVRYAESRGHEFDYQIPNAYQYRDYVIRALNADVPYDRFVVEHLAGDLLPEPRLNPTNGANESILGTGFWFLGEECHSPVDIRQDETDRVDNKIDVMSKTFLGLTLACARCHDHKFDAISTKDYYALSGFVLGMSYRQAPFEVMAHNRKIYEDVKRLEHEYRPKLVAELAEQMTPVVMSTEKYLIAAFEVAGELKKDTKKLGRAALIAAAAKRAGIESATLDAWLSYIESELTPDQPLFTWRQFIHDEQPYRAPTATGDSTATNEQVVCNPASLGPSDWRVDGLAFGLRPSLPGDLRLGTDPKRPIERLYVEAAAMREPKWDVYRNADDNERETTRNNWQQSGRTFKTPTTTLAGGKVWYLVRGSGRVYAAVDSHRVNNGPLHGQLVKQFAGFDRPQWIAHDLAPYAGHRVHFEFTPLDESELKGKQSPELAVLKVVEADQAPRYVAEKEVFPGLTIRDIEPTTDMLIKPMAGIYGGKFRNALSKFSLDWYGHIGDSSEQESLRLAAWMIEHPELFIGAKQSETPVAADYVKRQAALLSQLKLTSHTAPVAWEGSGVNEKVLIRGNHRTTGDLVERRFLEAIDGPMAPKYGSSSGRLELAERLLDRRDPLPARVMVNRLWQHLYGRGLVKTVDNFGIMGETPTHPELLDHLADRFMAEGWSIKKLLRTMALTSTYQMASVPSDATAGAIATVDPENKLWHRALSKRLEAEAIRDSILAVSGRLDDTMYGKSVPTYLTPFMEGRGRPGGGPLDGAGRRSVYLSVRRNFLNPMFQAFDFPTPFSSVGLRSNSNVPAQALSLMNGEFVRQQAQLWAERSAKQGTQDQAARIEQLYQTAYARKPTADETLAATEFLLEQRKLYDAKSNDDVRAWGDLCHVLLNVKEFIYIR